MATHFKGPVVSTDGFTGDITSTGTSTVTTLTVDTGTKTATASSGAATLNKRAGVITSESLTTAAGSDYTLTLTNSKIAATDIVVCSLQNGTNTTEPVYLRTVVPGSGSVVIKVRNAHASSALNGTIKISFVVVS